MSIDFDKPLETRKGVPVTLLLTGETERPHLGLMHLDEGDLFLSWRPDGLHEGPEVESAFDLRQATTPSPYTPAAIWEERTTVNGRRAVILSKDRRAESLTHVGLIYEPGGHRLAMWDAQGRNSESNIRPGDDLRGD